MGKPMVQNLLKKDYSVTVFDINEQAIQLLEGFGAYGAHSPKEVAANSDVVITMLPNGEHVQQVLLGEHGVVLGAAKGTIIIDMSSISPVVSKTLASTLHEKGLFMLDAPVSGGEPKAIDGTLSIMVGGNQDIFENVMPILKTVGKDVVLVGENGAGTTAKLANQVIVNVNIAAMSEALVLAAKAGINVEKMYEAIRGGLAGSAVLDAKVPMILNRDFQAGGRIDINLKDLTNVMETGQSLDVPLPLTSQVLQMFHSLKEEGKDALDHSGLIQYYEQMTNVEVKRVNDSCKQKA
jgi:2-hydroxy-3-oxopropionate reductase